MNLIYRIPLFDFDINNIDDLKKNRDRILNAIQLSSSDFVEKLQKHSFEDLDYDSFLKLKKYLIRGRYRPTPFGKFAACGLAEFGNNYSKSIQLETEEIDSGKPKSHIQRIFTSSYQSVPGINTFLGHYQGIVFEAKSQKWMQSTIAKNSLMDSVLKAPINFQKFSEMFESSIPNAAQHPEIKSLWEEMIESGFIIPTTPRNKLKRKTPNTGVDLLAKNSIQINSSIETQLKNLANEIGQLFQKEESKYLSDFKKWFSMKYDDRYCSLEALLIESEFINQEFFSENINPHQQSSLDFIQECHLKTNSKINSIDLGEIFEKSPLPKEIYDIQFLFRLNIEGKPIIENIVCNRPFVYIGRFSRANQILDLSHKIQENIYGDTAILYAYIDLIESDSINHICNTQSPFQFKISPIPSDSANDLKFSELFIGLEGNRIFLIHKSGKLVCPIVLHPLNGSQITHPIMRLLWELAHQDRFRFKPFASSAFQQKKIKPSLHWNGICLQTQKWILQFSDYPSPKSLKTALKELKVPNFFLAGTQDQELLLQKENQHDLDILFNEIKKRKTLTISTCPWIKSEIFQNEEKHNLYPQFVYHHSRKIESNLPKYPFNPITFIQKDSLNLIISCNSEKLNELLNYVFQFINQYQKDNTDLKWFFIQYPKNKQTEIRIRVLDLNPTNKEDLSIHLFKKFEKEKIHWKIESYYPETSKYGITSLQTSHELFKIESQFLSKKSKSEGFNIHLPNTEKTNLLLLVWLPILFNSEFFLNYFQEFKQIVKAWDHPKKNKYKREYEHQTNSATSIPQTRILGEFPFIRYQSQIQKHEYYLEGKSKQSQLLMNHIHMMVNRFFPNDTKLQEEKMWYFLYREMGKMCFRKQIPNSPPQSEPIHN